MIGKKWETEGEGKHFHGLLGGCGENVIIEDGVRIFHPENVFLGNNVYIGHDTILKGYYAGKLIIGDNVWIGQQCFFHAGGGIVIANNVGIGPQVKMHAARHKISETREIPIVFSEIELRPIVIEEDVNLGIGCMIMGGVTIKRGTRVGTNAVVTKTYPEFSVLVGVPACPINKES